MGTNVRLITDIIDFYEKTNRSGLAIFIDFQKAFDTLEWNFIFKTLKWFGFGPSYIKWIQTIYSDPVCHIKNNGFISESFKMSRGIRQGCQVSALLFVLCVEVLAVKIRENRLIKGVTHQYFKKDIKITQYADDTTLFVRDELEAQQAITIIETFGTLSGLRLNKTKCEGLWLGRNKHLQENCTLFNIKWPKYIRYLGIFVGYDYNYSYNKNWTAKIEKLKVILNSWSNRDLSLFGKIQVIKSLALSQILLSATLLPIPKNVIENVNTLLFNFIWKARDKLKRQKILKPITRGGLNMIDLSSFFQSIKAQWVNRIVEANPAEDSWVQIPLFFFKTLDIDHSTLKYNFDDSVAFPQISQLPEFYAEAFRYYNSAYVTDEETFKLNIYSETIWANKYIAANTGRKKSVLFLRNWIRSGIRNVSDLKFINGVLDFNFIYNKINIKCNIYAEYLAVRKALLPYKNILTNAVNANNVNEQLKTAKQFYTKLLSMKISFTDRTSDYLMNLAPNCSELQIFTQKVKNEPEIKLKEFNFKLLHGILPCNKNLFKWKLKSSDMCDVCEHSQSIEHLLFNCIYVQPLWEKVNCILNTNINFQTLLGLNNVTIFYHIPTIISFLIYKEWLLQSLNNRKKSYNRNYFLQT